MKEKMVRTSVSVYKYQLEWLKSHREVNLSGLVRKELDKLIYGGNGK